MNWRAHVVGMGASLRGRLEITPDLSVALKNVCIIRESVNRNNGRGCESNRNRQTFLENSGSRDCLFWAVQWIHFIRTSVVSLVTTNRNPLLVLEYQIRAIY